MSEPTSVICVCAQVCVLRADLQRTERRQVDRVEAYCIMANRLPCQLGSKLTMAACLRASLKRYSSMQRAGLPSRPALPAHSHTHLSTSAARYECQDCPCGKHTAHVEATVVHVGSFTVQMGADIDHVRASFGALAQYFSAARASTKAAARLQNHGDIICMK